MARGLPTSLPSISPTVVKPGGDKGLARPPEGVCSPVISNQWCWKVCRKVGYWQMSGYVSSLAFVTPVLGLHIPGDNQGVYMHVQSLGCPLSVWGVVVGGVVVTQPHTHSFPYPENPDLNPSPPCTAGACWIPQLTYLLSLVFALPLGPFGTC